MSRWCPWCSSIIFDTHICYLLTIAWIFYLPVQQKKWNLYSVHKLWFFWLTMFFKFGYELHQLLFSSLNITSVTGPWKEVIDYLLSLIKWNNISTFISGLIGVSAVTVVLVLILEASKVALAHSKFYSAILRPNDRPDCFTDDMFLVETQSPSNSIRF